MNKQSNPGNSGSLTSGTVLSYKSLVSARKIAGRIFSSVLARRHVAWYFLGRCKQMLIHPSYGTDNRIKKGIHSSLKLISQWVHGGGVPTRTYRTQRLYHQGYHHHHAPFSWVTTHETVPVELTAATAGSSVKGNLLFAAIVYYLYNAGKSVSWVSPLWTSLGWNVSIYRK